VGTSRHLSMPRISMPDVLRVQRSRLVHVGGALDDRPAVGEHREVEAVRLEHGHGGEPHVGKRAILKLDLNDFFPSVTFARVRGLLIAYGYQSMRFFGEKSFGINNNFRLQFSKIRMENMPMISMNDCGNI